MFTEYPKTAILAQGHTDSTGSEQHNQNLSDEEPRPFPTTSSPAASNPTRITALGYGEGNPVTGNETEAGRQQNRRVDLLLKGKAR